MKKKPHIKSSLSQKKKLRYMFQNKTKYTPMMSNIKVIKTYIYYLDYIFVLEKTL